MKLKNYIDTLTWIGSYDFTQFSMYLCYDEWRKIGA